MLTRVLADGLVSQDDIWAGRLLQAACLLQAADSQCGSSSCVDQVPNVDGGFL